jgi:methylmalonyl-CoA/ethylmalonyl-CoA epimerase
MKIDPHLKQILELGEVNQIGIVVKDIEKAMSNYSDIFGIAFPRVVVPDFYNKTYRGKPSDFRMKLALGMMGQLQIELIQVLQGKTIYEEFLERNGEGLHHFGFDVKNMDERIAGLQSLGIGVLQSGETANAKFAYMDTESLVGVIFEFLERDRKV